MKRLPGKSESPKSESPEEVKGERLNLPAGRQRAKGKKTAQLENNSAPPMGGQHSEISDSDPDSYRDDSRHSELNKSEIQTKSEIVNRKSEMEVHHHPEVEKKGLKEYVLEGLMIFLAVTMGFFAENLRENITDSHREMELAKTLYTELSADSVTARQVLATDLKKEKDLDYLYAYFKDSSLSVLPRVFYPAYTIGLFMVNSNTFEPKDGILSQLKNAGGMQYFKNVALQKLLGDLTVAINNVRNRNDQVYQFFSSPTKPFLLQHYDFNWLDQVRNAFPNSNGNLNDLMKEYTESKLFIKADILNLSTIERSESANLMKFNKQMQEATRLLQLKNYLSVNDSILKVLRSTYHLHNE